MSPPLTEEQCDERKWRDELTPLQRGNAACPTKVPMISKLLMKNAVPCFVAAMFLFLPAASGSTQSSSVVHIIQLDDNTINPVTAEYITTAIEDAEKANAQCLVIKMDTPGGLLNSTRTIVKRMLTAKVPVVVYISPSGSRAGSAGVFITYASHVAAMAPSTNIGAAHPVQMGKKDVPKDGSWEELRELIEELKDKKQNNAAPSEETVEKENSAEETPSDQDPMESKILNDTVAFIKAIAHQRGRNETWAVESVVKSSSITNDEALAQGVIEIIAESDDDLLAKLNGRVVNIDGQEVTLRTKEASKQYVMMDSRQKFFNILADPNIAYFLLILGFYGLLYEITHPGFGVPGILGAIFMILAFYSMQTLPTNYAGLALMILGLVLLVSEAFIPGFGLLTLGGLTCLILGSMLLFESADPVMRVSLSAIFTFSVTTAAVTLFLVRRFVLSRRMKVQGGREGLIGETGHVTIAIRPDKEGKVFVHGEIWNAVSDIMLAINDKIVVKEIQGLTLKVEKYLKEDQS